LPSPSSRARSGALLAPARTALPDLTFPARKDSRFALPGANRRISSCWKSGWQISGAGSRSRERSSKVGCVRSTTHRPKARALRIVLHDAPINHSPSVSRRSLSWWALLFMTGELPADAPAWSPGSLLLESQGLAVLRTVGGDRYASLECGPYGAGMAPRPAASHAPRGWRPLAGRPRKDPMSRRSVWYRSTLAHNAPRFGRRVPAPGDAVCETFDTSGEVAWVRGRQGELTRTVVSGPGYLLMWWSWRVAGARARVAMALSRTGDVAPGTWKTGDLWTSSCRGSSASCRTARAIASR